MRIEIRYPVTEASLGGMALLQVSFAFLIELFRPRQHGNLDSSRAEVLKESGVAPRGPYAGKIRLSVRRPRRRGRQVRFSVRRSRNPGRGIVQPLCGEWDRRRDKDNQSQNGSSSDHVSLPVGAKFTCSSKARQSGFPLYPL